MSCSVGCRRGSDPALLWLWHRPAATALIGPLAWEPPYAAGAAVEMAKRVLSPPQQFSSILLFYFLIFLSFLPLLGPLPQHMEVPRLGGELEL